MTSAAAAGDEPTPSRGSRPGWWLTQPSSRRSAWALAQRNRYADYARTELAASERFSRLYARLDAGRCEEPVAVADRVFWMDRRGVDEVKRLVVTTAAGTRTILDLHETDPAHTTLIDGFAPSPDGRRLAVWTSTRGQEDETLTIIDADTGARLDGPLAGTDPSTFVWAPDSSAFYAAVYADRDCNILSRTVGGDAWTHITTVPDGHSASSLNVSPDGKTLVFGEWIGDWTQENLLMASSRPGSTPRVIHDNVEGRSHAKFVGNELWLLTTVGSDRGRIVAVDRSHPDPANWRDIVAPSQSRIHDFTVAGNKIYVVSSYEGADRVTLHDAVDGALLGRLTLAGRGQVEDITSSGDSVLFSYSDYVTPRHIQHFNTRTSSLAVWAAPPPIPAMAAIRVESTVYAAPDGTLVPIDLIYKPKTGVDGPRPTILHAYGGFMNDDLPSYTPDIAAWVEAGGVYAHAHVRGGDIRPDWHRNGPDGKRQALDDLTAASRWLVAQGYTTPKQLGLFGASNGGWITTATAVLNPTLVGAVVAQCGLLDAVDFGSFGSGSSWSTEYGDATNPAAAAKLKAISPLHAVRHGVAYPPMLFPVGDDPRVLTPGHTYRMLDALQRANPKGTYLMRYDRLVGHGYGSRSRTRSELSDVLAFFGRHLGLNLSERTVRGERQERGLN